MLSLILENLIQGLALGALIGAGFCGVKFVMDFVRTRRWIRRLERDE